MSTQYIHFTDAQKEQARQTDLVSLLKSQGETVKRSGREYQWWDGSAKVTIRGNLWYHQYDQVGGDTIDFVRRYYNKSYNEAMEFLLGGNRQGEFCVSPPIEKKEPQPFVLPKKNDRMSRVYAYLLRHRKLHKDVLDVFVRKGMVYESADYHNAVFVGFDQDNIPRHAHKRGSGSKSTYKGNADNSAPEYSFHWHGRSEKLYLFEAPIDMLSFICMNKECWENHSYAACCGVGERVLFQMLKDNPHIQMVYLCLDNDEPGQQAEERIAAKLEKLGIAYDDTLTPIDKDWNQDLKNLDQEEVLCPTLQL